MNSWELRSVGRSTDPTYALYRWTLKDVMTGLFYEIRTMVYVCCNGCMLNWLYVNTWSMIMHVNYIYDFLMGLLSIYGGMRLHVYIVTSGEHLLDVTGVVVLFED